MKEQYLLDTTTVKTYLTQKLSLFHADEPLIAEEIGDGNINYVFRVRSDASGKSIIVKQADRLLRSSGRPLDLTRSKREAEALRIYAACTPQFIPQVYHYDESMSAICMEDIAYCGNTRKELMAGTLLPDQFAENAAAFLAHAVFPTSDLFIQPEEKKARVKAFINPELCAISETLVFSEPYCNGKNRNRVTSGNEAFVSKMLYTDDVLKAEVAALRETFMNKAEALIHGDLHTGSVFIRIDEGDEVSGSSGMKIIDPEFAFYGPIGYDLGNLIANLYFAWIYTVFSGTQGKDTPLTEHKSGRIAAAIEVLPQLFTAKALEQCRTAPLSDPLYNARYLRQRLAGIVAEAYGYAGTEMIRRTVGDTKVAELDAMGTDTRRISAERILINTARLLIKRRRQAGIGTRAAAYFRSSLKTLPDGTVFEH